jgi:hypothetical protein
VINRWEQGRAEVDALLNGGYLQKVKPDRKLAELYVEHAKLHLAASRQTLDIDPTGSFQLAYDACRKSLAAVLENQGLRATSKGGHRAVEDALRAQLVPPLGKQLNDFGWMRSLRNASEYPSFELPTADEDDALKAHPIAGEMIDLAERLLDQMPVY